MVTSELPKFPSGAAARPNILMFDDASFVRTVSEEQRLRFDKFLSSNSDTLENVVVLEIGAGTNFPGIRILSESVASFFSRKRNKTTSTLIRVNPRDPSLDFSVKRANFVSVHTGALAAISSFNKCLKS